jgi:hypothetical protein
MKLPALFRKSIVSVVLGGGTVLIAGLVSRLPFSALRDAAVDVFAFPGAVIGLIVSPGGPHAGRGNPSWSWVVMASNFVFYMLLWFIVLLVAEKLRGTRLHR